MATSQHRAHARLGQAVDHIGRHAGQHGLFGQARLRAVDEHHHRAGIGRRRLAQALNGVAIGAVGGHDDDVRAEGRRLGLAEGRRVADFQRLHAGKPLGDQGRTGWVRIHHEHSHGLGLAVGPTVGGGSHAASRRSFRPAPKAISRSRLCAGSARASAASRASRSSRRVGAAQPREGFLGTGQPRDARKLDQAPHRPARAGLRRQRRPGR